MIYGNLYGFNLVSGCDVPALEKYKVKGEVSGIPTINIVLGQRADKNFEAEIIVENSKAKMACSSLASYIELIDRYSIMVTADAMWISNSENNAEVIYNEVTGPAIMMASRFHGRAVLHGSAFLYNKKAYLVVASSGSGKSTLTSAMVKYQDADFITDDIISITEDGKSIFNGMHLIYLNEDSWIHQGYSKTEDSGNVFIDVQRLKKGYCGDEFDTLISHTKFEVGGIFFLYPDGNRQPVRIEEMNNMDCFIEAVKNIKLRSTLTGKLLIQEMNILNMLTSKAWGCRLHIKHDYERIEEAMKQIINYINGR